MNDNQRQDIKSITASREWKSVVEVLEESLEEMIDIRNINLEGDIKEQVYGALAMQKAVVKFLEKMKLVGKGELKLKPKNFK